MELDCGVAGLYGCATRYEIPPPASGALEEVSMYLKNRVVAWLHLVYRGRGFLGRVILGAFVWSRCDVSGNNAGFPQEDLSK